MINFNHKLYKSKISLIAFSLVLAASNCKKDRPIPPDGPSKIGTREELTKDSIYLYAKDTYFWNDALPSYTDFKPRSFLNFEAELDGFKTIKINPITNQPIDRYSFLDDGGLADELRGDAGDYGFSVFYNAPPSSDLRIKYVYGSSPATAQNLKRGDQITKINGFTNLNSATPANIDFVVDAIFGSHPTVSLTVLKANGTLEDVTITRGVYNLNPVVYTHVFTVGSKKVGYIVFNSFTTNAESELDAAFSTFSGQGVSEVIVDLRYNGGGSVSTADVLINLIAPASITGNLMYTTYWTKKMQDGQATILKNQKVSFGGSINSYFDYDYSPTEAAGNVERFNKRGSANITRAYFLVTGGTASASELVINSLKPVMDVKLIGKKTYGKPVGFFALHIDNLDMYIPQFQTKNSQNFGDYFNGMAVDKEQNDDVTKEFGDPTENLLALALNYAATGTFSVSNSKGNKLSSTNSLPSNSAEVDRLTHELDRNEFKGMVDTKLKLKKK